MTTNRADYMREWRAKNPDKVKASRAREAAKRSPGWWRDINRQRRYGVTPDGFSAMRIDCDDRCEVCTEPFDLTATGRGPGAMYPNVDHDHDTGQVRGLLCWSCNLAVAHVKGHESDCPCPHCRYIRRRA